MIRDHMIFQYKISIPGVNDSRIHSIECPSALVGEPTVLETVTTLDGIVS